jgi:two-component system sensor histidine kinase KdpD
MLGFAVFGPARLVRAIASIAVITVTTAIYVLLVHVNPTTVALTYLVAILLIATNWGIFDSTLASVAAVFCFNFFFLPPVGTLTIADPQNWVALIAFLITAIVASQLSGRATHREIEAASRQRDLERLYALSRGLLLTDTDTPIQSRIAQNVATAFQIRGVALYDARLDTIVRSGELDLTGVDDALRDVARKAISIHRPLDGVVITAIRLGGSPIGSLAVSDTGLSDTVLQSIANLAAIGLERARTQEAAARAEAARESGEVRATVLDALAHDFKTPLTSMKAASTELLMQTADRPRDHELASIVDEDLDRLRALVTDAVRMLRIDAGDFAVHRERQRLAPIVTATMKDFGARLDGHRVSVHVLDTLAIDADRELLGLALRQLLDNAIKYSPPAAMIEVSACSNGHVEITVRNSGSTIPDREQTRIFERFYRGAHARHIAGTGIGLAIVQQIAHAHGGTLSVSSTPSEGTAFTLTFAKAGPA